MYRQPGSRVYNNSVTAPLEPQPVIHVTDNNGTVAKYVNMRNGIVATLYNVTTAGALSGRTSADIIAGVAMFVDLGARKASNSTRIVFSYAGNLVFFVCMLKRRLYIYIYIYIYIYGATNNK